MVLVLLAPIAIRAEEVPVRNREGTVHGFLALRTQDEKLLASGDLIQTVRGGRVTCEVVFHFQDGSLDDEITEFSERTNFRLLQ